MFFFSCKTMRGMVILSGALFLMGIILQLLTTTLDGASHWGAPYLVYLAFISTLLSPVLLLSTLLLAMLPGRKEKLQTCEH